MGKKKYKLNEFIYIKFWEMQSNLQQQKSNSVGAWISFRRREEQITKSYEETFGDGVNIHYPHRGDGFMRV